MKEQTDMVKKISFFENFPKENSPDYFPRIYPWNIFIDWSIHVCWKQIDIFMVGGQMQHNLLPMKKILQK